MATRVCMYVCDYNIGLFIADGSLLVTADAPLYVHQLVTMFVWLLFDAEEVENSCLLLLEMRLMTTGVVGSKTNTMS